MKTRCPYCGHLEKKWTPDLMLAAGRRWVDETGKQPRAIDWQTAKRPEWAPSTSRCGKVFGSWAAYIEALGFEPQRLWYRDGILDALILWRETNGDWPLPKDWRKSGKNHPANRSVYLYYKNWSAAIRDAHKRQGKREMVPVVPVREAVARWASESDSNHQTLLAERLQMDESRMRRILQQQEEMTSALADRILAEIGAVDLWHTNDELAGRCV